MDHRELRKLVQLMNENDLVELEIEQEGMRVCLRKAGAHAPALPPGAAAPYPLPPAYPPPSQTPAAGAVPAEGGEGPAPLPAGVKEIPSPMVGTFYRRPSPESDPYVDVGTSVDEETVVCIVEAMKVNNEIKAEMRGQIVEILVEDGLPVEYDQPLFRVKVE